jgi:hypothetical protein
MIRLRIGAGAARPARAHQIHYDAIRRVEPATGALAEGVDEVQESVVQCLDCMHDASGEAH